MMLVLVMADSLVLLFVGWEGVGLCSYLLIGFWYTDAQKAFAGRKAFVTNRIGDFGFLLGMFLLVLTVGAFSKQATRENFEQRGPGASGGLQSRFNSGLSQKGPLTFHGLETFANALQVESKGGAVALNTPIADGPLLGWTFGEALTAVLLLFLLGAAGKSAQLPLYVWLPDAMAGPTPVSALIHAATMVTAGVYLFCRLSYLLVLSPAAMATVAVVGGLTALFAALIAFAQDDLKKVLAYSTVSQLGFMFMGVGMGVFWAGFLHVITHAFFKACLFLGAGSVMHGNADEGNIKKLGGLRHEMKWTWATFGIATLAITGIVPLSGFFSKDGILHGVHSTTLNAYPWVTNLVWILGLLTAACTAFYMTRLYLLTFEGTRAKDAKVAHAHESAGAMTGPLVILAALSVVFLVQGIPFMQNPSGGPKQTVMENFLAPVFHSAHAIMARSGMVTVHVTDGIPWGAWGMAWAIALLGGGLAVFMYTRFFPSWGDKPVPAFAVAVRKAASGKFFVDELYEKVILVPLKGLSTFFFKVVDAFLIDTVVVRGTAWLTGATGSWLRYFQTGDTQTYAAAMIVTVAAGIAYVVFKVLQ
jgi:NADH-quinone oxidoreductase subunit L